MKMVYLTLALAEMGVLLIVLSFFWPSLLGTEVVWTEEQAVEHSQAAAELHQLQHERIHEQGHEHDPQHAHPGAQQAGSDGEHDGGSFEAAKRRYEDSRAKLQTARSLRLKTATYLKWSGVICSVVGVVGYCLLRLANE